MASQQNRKTETPDLTRIGAQMWEAGSQTLLAGQRQAQVLWNHTLQRWGEMTGMWLNQFARCDESVEVLRRLQETTLAVTQSWMRLPLQLSGNAQPGELQEAVTQWTQAQGHAYRLWLRAFTGKEAGSPSSETVKSAESEQKHPQSLRSKSPAGKTRKRQRTSSRS